MMMIIRSDEVKKSVEGIKRVQKIYISILYSIYRHRKKVYTWQKYMSYIVISYVIKTCNTAMVRKFCQLSGNFFKDKCSN